jgi:inosine/xanthosine triphosphate pyrophosphatase family protein
MEEIELKDETVLGEDVAPESQPEAHDTHTIEEEPGSNAKNFRELRRILKEQQSRIRELEHVALQREQEPVKAHEEDERINPDDYPTWAQVQKAIEKKAEQKARQLLEEQEIATAEDKVRAKHRDYDDVVTEESVRQLVDDDPILADTLRNSPNPYLAAYRLIKKSSFYQQKVALKESPNAKKIQENVKKPISSNAIQNERPLAAAHSFASLNSSDREALWREMQSCSKLRY